MPVFSLHVLKLTQFQTSFKNSNKAQFDLLPILIQGILASGFAEHLMKFYF